ncbi:hypothetical protein EGO56_06955 [Pantoea vagans]|nr:hypothetical protein EGO56_06955 [Pantoea vagans]
MGVILVVLTGRGLRFSLFISQLLAKAIPVREPNSASLLRKLSGLFAFLMSVQMFHNKYSMTDNATENNSQGKQSAMRHHSLIRRACFCLINADCDDASLKWASG